MKAHLWDLGLWALVILCGVAVTIQARSLGILSAEASIAQPSPALRAAPVIRDRAQLADSIIAAAEYVAAHDPFRIGHEPSLVAFGSPPVANPPVIQRPTLTLVGIVGSGSRWSAIVAGIPGREGHLVLQTGDTAGGLHVRGVDARSAVIEGRDTTWTLRPGSPWQ